MELGDDIVESPRKFYIAYRVIRNFVCLEIHKGHLLLYFRLDPEEIDISDSRLRDVTDIGHYGTGNLEIRVEDRNDVDLAKSVIKRTYANSSS